MKQNIKKGFTLVEVIVVIVIIAILAAIAIPALTGYIRKAEDKQYVGQAREFLQVVTTMKNDLKAESNVNIYDIGRTREYYLEQANTQINKGKNYKIMHITCEGTDPGGKLVWQELTGKKFALRPYKDVSDSTKKNSFTGYVIVTPSSDIVAGLFYSDDDKALITWGLKEQPMRTFYNRTNLVVSNVESPETFQESDVDTSVGYIVYKREEGTVNFYKK